MILNIPELPEELKKLVTIATDIELAEKLRVQAIESISHGRSYEALLALLSLAADEKLTFPERDLAVKKARDLIKAAAH
ncbi:MAG: hypothetical protein PHR56_08505 [Dehalococcoidales bacterium]|nr:hypothetical protein [Dehalococcoidales bacterium]